MNGHVAGMVSTYGFGGAYQTVQRFVRKLEGAQAPEPALLCINLLSVCNGILFCRRSRGSVLPRLVSRKPNL